MNACSILRTYVVPERFEKAMKRIRAALRELDLEIVGEFPLDPVPRAPEGQGGGSKVVLVTCPILEFEGLALERAGAVFFPLHLLVSDNAERTQVRVGNPAELVQGRLPAGAGEPMERLVARIELALDAVLTAAE